MFSNFVGEYGNGVVTVMPAEDEVNFIRSMSKLREIAPDSLGGQAVYFAGGSRRNCGENTSITFACIVSQARSEIHKANLHPL
jgi:hypothetical protein